MPGTKTTLRPDQVRQPLVNTTAYWEEHAAYVPKKDQEIIYSDGGTITQGGQTIPVPKYKVGDGVTTVGNLPFTDSDTRQGMAGTLDTTNTSAQTPSASESLSGDVNLHKVSKTGSYDDLLNKPTIPTVNDAVLTIQKNGTTVDTFSANASRDKTIDITVPVKLGDLDDVLITKVSGGDILIFRGGKTNAFINTQLGDIALPASTKYAASISLSIDSSTYVVTAQLKDQDGNNLGSAQTIDLPLESVVVSGSYNAQTKKVVLTLQNGSTIEFSVADLVAGLQSEITAQNPLSADLVVDGTTNKVFTLTMKTKLDGIEAGAEVNVQSDWNQTDNTQDDYIKNKPTIPTLRTMNHEQLTDSTLGDINIHDGFYFPNAAQDYDGNWYGAVVIGDQVWLGENLKTTHYNNGDEIPLYTKNTDGSVGRYYPGSGNNGSALTPHPELVPVFGYLYSNQLAQNEINEDYYSIEKTISPSGFHIPSSGDFNNLRNYIKNNKRYILNDNNLKIGKSLASTDYWNTSSTDYAVGNDLTQNNKTGFNAKPTGYVPASTGWGAAFAFETTYFMNTYKSSSNGLYVSAISSDSASFGAWTMGGNPGLAVRCVSNLTPLQFRDWYIKQYGSLQHHLPEELGVPIITFRHW